MPRPPAEVALDHYRDRQKLVHAVGHVAGQMWSEVDPALIVPTWTAQLPELTAVVAGAQLGAARPADAYLDEVLVAQEIDAASVGAIAPESFAGAASDARGLLGLLQSPAFAALQAIGSGHPVDRAMAAGRANLDMLVRTQVADAGRLADQVALTARPAVTGYVRVANGPTCSRCMILVGQTYRWSQGFQRHPRCDCMHLPTLIARAATLRQDPAQLYARMSPTERTYAGYSQADQQAIADGADIGQVVNARRGMVTAGARTTTEGTTVRGLYGGYHVDPATGQLTKRSRDELVRGANSRVRRAATPRLSVDGIYRLAGEDREAALALLREQGYIRTEVRERVAAAEPATGRATGGAGAPAPTPTIRPVLEQARTTARVKEAFIDEFERITGRRPAFTYFTGSAATAREHAEGILRGLERFPDAKLDTVTVGRIRLDSTEYAHAQGSVITFSDRWCAADRRSEYLAKLRSDVADWETPGGHGWHPRGCGNAVAIGAHEFGHVLDLNTLGAAIRTDLHQLLADRAAASGLGHARGVVTAISEDVSEYALRNDNELVAEAFSDVIVNGGNASQLSRDIYTLIEREYSAGSRRAGIDAISPAATHIPVPEPARPYHRSVDDVQDIVVTVRSGQSEYATKLRGGNTDRVELVPFNNGDELVRKTGHAEQEQAASMIARALGIDTAPRVYRDSADAGWMDYVAGETPYRAFVRLRGDPAGVRAYQHQLDALTESDDGQRIGLLDHLLANTDRNNGNFILRPDGRLAPIDHGSAFLDQYVGLAGEPIEVVGLRGRGSFAAQYLEHGDPYHLVSNRLTPGDVERLRDRLRALAPDFVHIGRERWLDYALAVLDEIAPYAHGTVDLFP